MKVQVGAGVINHLHLVVRVAERGVVGRQVRGGGVAGQLLRLQLLLRPDILYRCNLGLFNSYTGLDS